MPKKVDWKDMSTFQIGKYAEFYAIMKFTRYGFDVYSSEIDDKGIDFIIRNRRGKFYAVQVKYSRMYKPGVYNYIFFPKHLFITERDNLLGVIAFFDNSQDVPHLFIIPSKEWRDPKNPLRYYDYESKGKKLKNKYGILSNREVFDLLKERYDFDKIINEL